MIKCNITIEREGDGVKVVIDMPHTDKATAIEKATAHLLKKYLDLMTKEMSKNGNTQEYAADGEKGVRALKDMLNRKENRSGKDKY